MWVVGDTLMLWPMIPVALRWMHMDERKAARLDRELDAAKGTLRVHRWTTSLRHVMTGRFWSAKTHPLRVIGLALSTLTLAGLLTACGGPGRSAGALTFAGSRPESCHPDAIPLVSSSGGTRLRSPPTRASTS